MNWSKKDMLNICKIVTFGIILYWVLNNLSTVWAIFCSLCSILSPFIWGVAIAFVINIPMTIFETKVFVKRKKEEKGKDSKKKIDKPKADLSKIKRFLCILLSFIIIILVIVGVIFLVIPDVINVIWQTISCMPELFANLENFVNQLIIDYPEIATSLTALQNSLENVNSEVITELTTFGSSLLTSSFGVVKSTISSIFKAVIAVIFSVYVLMGKEKLWIGLKKLIYAFINKKSADKICEVAILAKQAFYNFITGQFTECIILGVLCAIGMAILGLPYSATVGTIVAVSAFVPIVGAFFGGFIGVILLLPISLTQAIVFLVFFIILQQIEGNIIYPRVVGSSVGLPGIFVLVAITVGGALDGIIGMVIALPVTSVLYTLINETVDKRLKKQKDINIENKSEQCNT